MVEMLQIRVYIYLCTSTETRAKDLCTSLHAIRAKKEEEGGVGALSTVPGSLLSGRIARGLRQNPRKASISCVLVCPFADLVVCDAHN